jgi:uncharacterized protein YndB with AHSA1/START domain
MPERERGGLGAADSVVRTVVLDAPPQRVWEAVTDETMLREWLAPEVELEPYEGGAVLCRFADGEERRGEVELVEEAERLAFSWHREGGASSRVEMALDAVADGTRLTVIETGLVPSGAPSLMAGGMPSPTAADAAATLMTAGWSAPLARLPLALGRLVLA